MVSKGEASFVVSDKEFESVEVFVFDSSREVFGGEMIFVPNIS